MIKKQFPKSQCMNNYSRNEIQSELLLMCIGNIMKSHVLHRWVHCVKGILKNPSTVMLWFWCVLIIFYVMRRKRAKI